MLGGNCGTFHKRQKVALYTFAADAGAAPFAALADLVYLVDEDNAVLFARGKRARLDFLVVDHLRSFFLDQQRPRRGDAELAPLTLLPGQRGKHATQLLGHFFHARRRHDFDAEIYLCFDFDVTRIQCAFAQLLAQLLPSLGVASLDRLRFAGEPQRLLTRRQERIEDAVFGAILGLAADLRLGLFARHLHRDISQIAHDLLDILADIADLGELGRLDLDERGVRQMRKAARDLGLAHPGLTDHQDIFRRHLVAQRRIQLHAPPAVAQRDGDRTLGRILANDVAVEFVDDFAGSQF